MIPEATIRRLSIYLRCLRYSLAQGEYIVQSMDIARKCRVSSSLMRKDLSYFGGFGIKGRGYDTKKLIEAIERIIGIHIKIKLIIVGMGNLGRALIRHLKEISYFKIIGAFDRDERKVGGKIEDVEVFHESRLPSFLRERKPEIALLAIPPESLQEVVNLLGEGEIKGILSFALSPVKIPVGVEISFVEIASEIEYLSYKINKRGREK